MHFLFLSDGGAPNVAGPGVAYNICNHYNHYNIIMSRISRTFVLVAISQLYTVLKKLYPFCDFVNF